jgi:hypothetical protein
LAEFGCVVASLVSPISQQEKILMRKNAGTLHPKRPASKKNRKKLIKRMLLDQKLKHSEKV